MLITEKHPFNQNLGLQTIKPETNKIIIGTFPAFEVVNNLNPRLAFYYGSSDNKFWDIIRDVLNENFEYTIESIAEFLVNNNFGIIDIIETCYRKKNRSSADEDLSIIDQLNFIELIQNNNCTDFYTTSKLVTDLIKKQIKPVAQEFQITDSEINGFKYQTFRFKLFQEEPEFNLRFFTLYSPSDNGLRGIQKGLNSAKINISANEYRRNQYNQLLNL